MLDMPNAAINAKKFYQEVATSDSIWTIEDDDGIPAPVNASGERAMPFWSTEERANTIITTVPAYANFRAKRISCRDFLSRWIRGLEKDGLLVGINWSGQRASGYDIQPSDLKANIEYEINKLSRP